MPFSSGVSRVFMFMYKGDVFLPISKKALGYAVGSSETLDTIGCRKCGVRWGWMPWDLFFW